MSVALVLILVAGLAAIVARLRLRRYDRLDRRQFAEFTAAETQRNVLRSECQRLWLEG